VIIRLALWFLALSLVVGQLIRVPRPGQSGGLVVSDLAVIGVLAAAFFNSLVSPRPSAVGGKKISPLYYLLLYTPFVVWSLFTLGIHVGDYERPELMIAAAYWLRTSCYLLLAPALLSLARSADLAATPRRSWMAAIAVLAAAAGLQLVFLPDLAALPPILVTLSGGGWDPHIGRAVGTWLDPNFFGAFLAIAALYCLGCFFQERRPGARLFVLALAAAVGLLLIMTQSRSSFLALGGAVALLSPVIILRLAHRRSSALWPGVVGVGGLLALAAILAALMLGERLGSLVTFDPTVQARLEALTAAWRLAQDHLWVGVGYNAWQFAARDAGLVGDVVLHSRAGSDSSFLTLLVTTGLPGVTLFVLPWLVIGVTSLQRWLRHGHVLSLVVVASLLTLTLHSQFVNSWLYAHLLVVMAVIVALAEGPTTYDRV